MAPQTQRAEHSFMKSHFSQSICDARRKHKTIFNAISRLCEVHLLAKYCCKIKNFMVGSSSHLHGNSKHTQRRHEIISKAKKNKIYRGGNNSCVLCGSVNKSDLRTIYKQPKMFVCFSDIYRVIRITMFVGWNLKSQQFVCAKLSF